jgi:predicted ribosome quality control (RQC) complex YloA/Tae2 family protein
MPEDERIETLNDLLEAKAETTRALERLPVVAHSNKMERHKKELEDKLIRLERAIETFSKKTVYVAF